MPAKHLHESFIKHLHILLARCKESEHLRDAAYREQRKLLQDLLLPAGKIAGLRNALLDVKLPEQALSQVIERIPSTGPLLNQAPSPEHAMEMASHIAAHDLEGLIDTARWFLEERYPASRTVLDDHYVLSLLQPGLGDLWADFSVDAAAAGYAPPLSNSAQRIFEQVVAGPDEKPRYYAARYRVAMKDLRHLHKRRHWPLPPELVAWLERWTRADRVPSYAKLQQARCRAKCGRRVKRRGAKYCSLACRYRPRCAPIPKEQRRHQTPIAQARRLQLAHVPTRDWPPAIRDAYNRYQRERYAARRALA